MKFLSLAVGATLSGAALAATSSASASSASSTTYTCSSSEQCPESAPCCSQYGECGTGYMCLMGCYPAGSYNLTSCVGLPVCQNKTTNFTNSDIIGDQFKYLGNASEYDWVTNNDVETKDDVTLLVMKQNSTGTVLTSTHSMWYGKVSATIKTSYGRGVVSSFILYGGEKDEIDNEFIGVDLETLQTNYYFEGILSLTHAANITISEPTNTTWHTYTIDWTEDYIQWSVDGNVGRTLKKSDTLNSTTGVYNYPQSPMNVQLSLWPGGASSNAEGTIAWAGGAIDWDAPAFSDPGYLDVQIKSIEVECYSPPSGTLVEGDSCYKFNSSDAYTQDTVYISGDSTVLGSQEACGFDMDKGKGSSSSSASASGSSGSSTASSSTSSRSVATVSQVVQNSTSIGVVSGSTVTAVISVTSDAAVTATGTAAGTTGGSSSSTSSYTGGFNQGEATTSAKGMGSVVVGSAVALLASAMSLLLMI